MFSTESVWRSGFECLLRHQGILQEDRFLLHFLVYGILKEKLVVVGFQKFFIYLFVFMFGCGFEDS